MNTQVDRNSSKSCIVTDVIISVLNVGVPEKYYTCTYMYNVGRKIMVGHCTKFCDGSMRSLATSQYSFPAEVWGDDVIS